MGGNVSTASSTPAGGWYADPLDASLLRWWDGSTWSKQTMPADPALSPSTADPKPTLAAVPPLPRGDEPYVPPNSVFRMAETTAGDAYVPEWSGLADISPEVALSGVPVQLALTSTPAEPPIPVSADVFPILRGESEVTPTLKEPAWKVEAPLAAPVDQLFPVASAPTLAAAAFPAMPVTPTPTPAPVRPAAPVPPAAPVIALGAPISPPAPPAPPASSESTLSPHVFPAGAPVAPVAQAAPAVAVTAPLVEAVAPGVQAPPVVQPPAPATAPAPVPQPAGDSFPGLVPSAPAPTLLAEPPAPPAVPEPMAAPAPAPAPTIYAGPEVATNPVAPPDFQPFAASTPGATYTPVEARPIPQPLQLGAPTIPATPSEVVPAAPSAPTEYWPTQGTPAPGAQYQPNPGDYVPFDPNSVNLQPVPVIPFSSRDPYNSASTSRPGMNAYAAAPVGPIDSTWTGGLAFMLLAPLISTATFFVWSQLTTTAGLSLSSVSWLPFALGGIGLIGLAAAQIDRNALARRGYFDLASPFWVLLLPPLIYLIVRAMRLRGQGRGAGPAIGLWALSYVAANILIGVISIGWLSTPTPERVAFVESTIQQQLAAKNITATVACPAVTSFAPGSTFDCTVKAQGASLPIRVTVTDWDGAFTATPVSTSSS